MNTNELPLGFGFALAQNPEAMQKFSALPQEKRSELLQKAHNVSSKEELTDLVDHLSSQEVF